MVVVLDSCSYSYSCWHQDAPPASLTDVEVLTTCLLRTYYVLTRWRPWHSSRWLLSWLAPRTPLPSLQTVRPYICLACPPPPKCVPKLVLPALAYQALATKPYLAYACARACRRALLLGRRAMWSAGPRGRGEPEGPPTRRGAAGTPHSHTHTHARARAHAHAPTRTHTRTHAYSTHACTHARTHLFIHD